ncbi:MAG TPA: TlpA family protein disulfide reductase [Thermoanaerobacterales bacterium]|nr:TlpA family protein disulfide reductase [Thermoanaerobacterales bacterium]
MKNSQKGNLLFLLLIILTLIATGCSSVKPNKDVGNNDSENEAVPAPTFELMDLSDTKISLEDLKGKYVVLNFWQTTCPYCVKGMPDLNKLHEDYKESDVVVIGVNIGEDMEKIIDFAQKENISFTILLDPSGKTAHSYSVRGLPTTYFIDDKGFIYDAHIGPLNYNQLVDIIEK